MHKIYQQTLLRAFLPIFLFFILISSAFGASFKKNIQELMKKNNLDVLLVDSYKLTDVKGLYLVVLEIKEQKQRFPIFASSSGESIFAYSPSYSSKNTKDKENINKILEGIQSHNESSQKPRLASLFNSIDKDNYIYLKSTTKGVKKDTIIVTDPDCPYCRAELKETENKLKETNIKILLAPVRTKKSTLAKAALAIKESKEAKSTKEKIAILRKYYKSIKLSKEQLEVDISVIEENIDKVYSSGIVKGVPFIFEMP